VQNSNKKKQSLRNSQVSQDSTIANLDKYYQKPSKNQAED
jgi:hypothetical protein